MDGMLDETYAQTVAVLPAYARGMAGRLAALWAPSGQPAMSTSVIVRWIGGVRVWSAVLVHVSSEHSCWEDSARHAQHACCCCRAWQSLHAGRCTQAFS